MQLHSLSLYIDAAHPLDLAQNPLNLKRVDGLIYAPSPDETDLEGALALFLHHQLPVTVLGPFEDLGDCLDALEAGATRLALGLEELNRPDFMAALQKTLSPCLLSAFFTVKRRRGNWYPWVNGRQSGGDIWKTLQKAAPLVGEFLIYSADDTLPFSPDLALAQSLAEDIQHPIHLGSAKMQSTSLIEALQMGLSGGIISLSQRDEVTAFKREIDRHILPHTQD